jgi:hypothetical protein
MRQTAALKILYDFLRKRNKMGTFIYFITCKEYGITNSRNIDAILKRIEKTAEEETNLRKAYFRDIMGNMVSSKLHFKNDYIYLLYREWIEFIDNNWSIIDFTYLTTKEKFNNGKNI